MQEELHAIWRRTAMTVVFLTHSVEEAVYLGTDVVVMSPRPGRIIERHEVGFSRASGDRDNIRSIKASPEFVGVREHVLGLIWRTRLILNACIKFDDDQFVFYTLMFPWRLSLVVIVEHTDLLCF
jgi:ABC-type taurine transport system ATPase subunit